MGPPRQLWLPPLGIRRPPMIWWLRYRGRPWDVDYGDNPGLVLPVALEDRPREHRQDVFCLDVLSDNALIIGAPKRGATTALMTMITTGALMYRPERVQFYCVAASGPQLAAVGRSAARGLGGVLVRHRRGEPAAGHGAPDRR